MMIRTEKSAYLVACGARAITWIGTAMLGHRTEAWDAPPYWVAAYPALALVLAWISFEMPLRPWRWVLAAMFTQAAVLFLSNPSGNLLPLGEERPADVSQRESLDETSDVGSCDSVVSARVRRHFTCRPHLK